MSADLRGVIDAFATGTYTVTRRGTPTSVKGRMVPGATSTFSIVASVQPGGRNVRQVPEGRSASDVRTIYTVTELRAGAIPDMIAIDGETYEVYSAAKWDAFGSTHYVVHAARQVIP